ncbi:Apolipoprotein A-I [Merluccius polli]|uniref:Apolipoprotein A-I n=1 Tax=Merluccius polli TaxID=89951 RepID=A0AA47NSB9_MERPO|nr:Apolipoprotein A-I [Merluccius polli]
MKFVALALTLLLALGCQTQDVPPNQLDQIRDTALLYLNQVKESAQKTLDHLDGTEYAEYKVKLSQSLDQLNAYAQTLTPYGEAFSTQFVDATNVMRDRALRDMDDLRLKLEPRRQELHKILQQQAEEYRAKLEPIFKEYVDQNQERMDNLKARLQPIMDEMRTKMEANVEETKTKVMPMVEDVRSKLTERLEQLRTMAGPYVDEYQESLTKAVGDAKDKISPHAQDLQAKLEPYIEDLKTKFMSMYNSLSEAIQA